MRVKLNLFCFGTKAVPIAVVMMMMVMMVILITQDCQRLCKKNFGQTLFLFHLIFLFFFKIYPENSHVVFCPNNVLFWTFYVFGSDFSYPWSVICKRQSNAQVILKTSPINHCQTIYYSTMTMLVLTMWSTCSILIWLKIRSFVHLTVRSFRFCIHMRTEQVWNLYLHDLSLDGET